MKKLGCMVLVILLIIVIGGAGYGWLQMQPTAKSEQAIEIQIQQGMGTSKIADLLDQEGLIKNSLLFKVYLKTKNEGKSFKAGKYAMTPGMTYDEIIKKLNTGDVIPDEVIRFTIPEGYTVIQMAEKLSTEHGLNKDEFLKLANEPAVFTSAETGSIPSEAPLLHRLEGYLFPETYELKKGSTEKDIIQRMLDELDKKVKQLPTGWEQQMKEHNLDFHQLMTVASLIEREVVVDSERGLVAGVIYNRLKQNKPLQIDATIQYLFDKPKDRLFNKDLKIESPYNTYLHDGLPPGPIASPSLASIEAALNPTPSKYLYYVTKKDGTQTHLFAETYKQHLANIKKSKETAQ
ncbi:endolytic transglycosylase MltG [Paenibacillus selenitireducens]|nr:endolytic transglycosylase MltG [Paenibacillus selenitireducens]